jgi:hypothetical protein
MQSRTLQATLTSQLYFMNRNKLHAVLVMTLSTMISIAIVTWLIIRFF